MMSPKQKKTVSAVIVIALVVGEGTISQLHSSMIMDEKYET